MTGRAWAIKLGSGGQCVPFCTRHGIVGVGWKDVDAAILATGDREALSDHLKTGCGYESARARGSAVGQLYRFANEAQLGDYVLYYDPPNKAVVLTRIVSGPLKRDFDLADETDVWHYRRVEYPIAPIPILDFYGALKGAVLGPRLSFWSVREFEIVDLLARGLEPHVASASDPEIEGAYRTLASLVLKRAEALDATDWEWLVVDYFKAQGARVDERHVGGSAPIIDLEARFDHGEFGDEVWRVQVKRYQGQEVDWPTIEQDFAKVGDARFCFVSVYGFTAEARQKAEAEDVRLLQAADFVRFLLTGTLRDRIRRKLQLPMFATLDVETVAQGSAEVGDAIAGVKVTAEKGATFKSLLAGPPVVAITEGTPITNLAWEVAHPVFRSRLLRTYERPSGSEDRVVGFVLKPPRSPQDVATLKAAIEACAGVAASLVALERAPLELGLGVDAATVIEARITPSGPDSGGDA